jgi:hypothetical protein
VVSSLSTEFANHPIRCTTAFLNLISLSHQAGFKPIRFTLCLPAGFVQSDLRATIGSIAAALVAG